MVYFIKDVTEKNQTEEMWVAILLLVFTTNLKIIYKTGQSTFLVLPQHQILNKSVKWNVLSMDYIDVNKKNIINKKDLIFCQNG